MMEDETFSASETNFVKLYRKKQVASVKVV